MRRLQDAGQARENFLLDQSDGEGMLNTRIAQGLLVLVVVIASGSLWAKKPTIDESIWIVELTDPPTVQFRGETSQTVAAGRVDRKVMAATAPSVTGEPRLRTDSQAVRQYVDYLDRRRGQVLEQAEKALGIPVKPKFVYRHLKNGFAAPMNAAEALRLAELPGVRSVQPNIIQYVQTDAGPDWIGAPNLWTGTTGAPDPTLGEGTVLGVIDTGVNWASIFFDLSQSPTPVTNPRGQFFGLCNDVILDIPCSEKLIGVYDFTDEDTNGFDPDGHGSHVASTAVGLPLSFNLDFDGGGPAAPVSFQTSGVAPRASFISYKACEADPDEPAGNFGCPLAATSAALEQAIEDGVDVVNFSIGGEPFDPWAVAGNQRLFLNVREAGIVPVTSAGNSGPGDFSVSSPANVPWVLAVANALHGRILANRLINVSGGPFPLGSLVGQGVTGGSATLPIVHARDFGNALCGEGPAESGPACDDNTGLSNPFPPGTFDGQIVVCDRGQYGRIEKGKNVQLAGAAGMILANTEAQGESTNADEHCLPATHVGNADGNRLRDWLDSGSGQQGSLTGTQRFIDQSAAGRLNDSSARGLAVGAPDLMKPNLTAPGTSVLAAGTEINSEGTGPAPGAANQLIFLTGTSMSAPHVAGAALLLRSANPAWGADEVISALETTAAPGIVRNSDDSEARVPDRGAGGVQVDLAAQAGLYLPVSEAEFLAANPSLGGDPGALNLPGVVSGACVATCTFTRTVRALGAGTWNVSVEGEVGIQVTPNSFTLSEGEQRELQIEISRGTVRFGQWGAGSVVLTPVAGDFTTQRLPVGALIAAGEPPDPQSFIAESNRGRGEMTIDELVEIEELVLRTSSLLLPARRSPLLEQDPTPLSPFDTQAGTETQLVDVPADALLLSAETFASTAEDIDLYVGRDLNGDGIAQENEEVCASLSPIDLERCEIELPEAGEWWVLVQNWTSSASGSDRAPFEFAVFREERDPSLVVTAPGAHPGGALTVPVYWDQPAMGRNDIWQGVVAIASSPDQPADVGIVPVSVIRTGTNAPAETALFEGQPYPVVLPAGSTHNLLYFDVPPGMAALNVDVEGAVSNVTIRRRGFDELAATAPQTPPAPDQVLLQATQSENLWNASLQLPESGRYFVVVENEAPTEAAMTVTASAEKGGVVLDPPAPASSITGRGAWSAARPVPIRQGIDWQVGGGGRFAIWYTYDESGIPTFYITDTVPVNTGQEPIGAFFNAVLFRSTSNDVRSSLAVVGEVQVTQISDGEMIYAWRLKGNHGAEIFDPVSGDSCPTVPSLGDDPVPLLGTWFSPDTTAGGSTVLITETTEAWIRFYFDNTNSPRWVIADTELPPTLPGGNRMEVLDVRGFCIYCEQVPITDDVVGTLERVFIDETTVREVSDYVAGPPINASIETDRELVLLSFPVDCPNQ